MRGIRFLREHSAVPAALILLAGFVLAFLGAAKSGVKHYSYTDFKSGYMEQKEEKKKALLSYAEGCGLYHAFGLLKMNIARTMQTRNLFEDEYQVYQLYTVSGAADLKKRASTAHFSDIALGHRSWYNGAGGYPAKYVRIDSPYRQMTDVAAVVACLLDLQEEDGQADIQLIQREAGRRFSPMVASCLSEEATAARLLQLLRSDGKAYYQTIYQELIVESDFPGVHIYTSNWFTGWKGKNNHNYTKRSSAALEASYLPNAINYETAIKPICKANKTLTHEIRFRLRNISGEAL